MPGPYDRLFKTMAEEDPRGLLHLFGTLPLHARARVEVLDRELNLPALSVDHVYGVWTPGAHWMAHYEMQTRYKSDVPERLAWYGQALTLKFRLPVEMVLILALERHAPRVIPDQHWLELRSVRTWVGYRVVRLWQMEGRRLIDLQRPSLLPWLPLMDSTPTDLQQGAEQITATGDPKLAAEFMVLGGLRYDRNDLARMLGKAGAMFTDEMLQESSTYQMILEKGMKKGIKQGIEKGIEKGIEQGRYAGRIEEARRNLQRVLALRFPELSRLRELDAIDDPVRLETLLEAAVTARSPAAVCSLVRGRKS